MPYLWMVLSAAAFSLMSTCARAVRLEFSWQTIALARAGLVLGFALALAAIARADLVFWRPRSIWLRSVAGSTSLLLSFYAITRIPVSDFLALTHMYPIWVAMLSWPLLHERPAKDVWFSIVVGLCGVQLINQAHFSQGNFAALVALASSFTSALSVIGLHRVKNVDPRAIVVHFSAVALVFVSLVTVFIPGQTPPQEPTAASWWLLLGVGVSATAGQVLLTKAFSAGAPSRVAIVGLTQVGFGMLCDIVFFHETFDRYRLGGITLVMLPTAWMMATRQRRKKAELEEKGHAATT